MPARLAPLEAAVLAYRDAGQAIFDIDALFARVHAGESVSDLHNEIDLASATLLVTAEKMRAAIHEYQIVVRRITGGL
jgi:hypothetical protein